MPWNFHIGVVVIFWGWPKKRPNVVPIVDDARHPHKYAMMVKINFYLFYNFYIGRDC